MSLWFFFYKITNNALSRVPTLNLIRCHLSLRPPTVLRFLVVAVELWAHFSNAQGPVLADIGENLLWLL